MADPDDMRVVMSRQQALACGAKRFWSGEPCPAGHLDFRTTKNGRCLTCSREDMRVRRGSNPTLIARLAEARARILPSDAPAIVTRADAKVRGLIRYFPGTACIGGHFSERMTKSKICLACHRERATKRRTDQPELVNAIKARSYVANRDKTLASVKLYQKANTAAIRKRQRAFREANKEAIAARMKVWSAANRPVLRQHERNRRAREAGAEGTHTAKEIAAMAKRQSYRCAHGWCRVSIRKGWHTDHIVPLARGGTNWIANIQLLCAPCNQSKHARDPVEWAREHDRLL